MSSPYNEAVVLFEKKEYSKAFNIFSDLADKGDASSSKKLGIMYFWGFGVEKNLSNAYGHFLIAAKAGYEDAQFYCAKINYLQGDVLIATEKLRASAKSGFVPSYYLLGWLLLNKSDLKDEKQGLKFISEAAKAGHIKAMGYKFRLIVRGKYGFWGYMIAPYFFMKVIFYAIYLSIKGDDDPRLFH